MAKKKTPGTAKKKTPKTKQKLIEGTYDKVPKAVQTLADKYVDVKRKKADALGQLNTARDILIVAMKKHDVVEILIDDGDKRLILDESQSLKIKKIKKPKGQTPEAISEGAV